MIGRHTVTVRNPLNIAILGMTPSDIRKMHKEITEAFRNTSQHIGTEASCVSGVGALAEHVYMIADADLVFLTLTFPLLDKFVR